MYTQNNVIDLLMSKKSAVVIGLGISNVPLVRFLCKLGVSVIACDKKSTDQVSCADELLASGVSLSLGDDYLSPLKDGDHVIFRSPGIRPDIPEISDALLRGCSLSSEMELFFELCPAKIIGITGSDGKTTTTTITYKLLELECKKSGKGNVYVGGNIGAPLLPLVDKMTSDDFAVVELSSFQLMTMKKSPEISVITNITPNHLNWHTDMQEYKDAKLNILSSECKKLITNFDCEETSGISSSDTDIVFFSRKTQPPSNNAVFFEDDTIFIKKQSNTKEILKKSDILLPGMHNVENYMAAIAATSEFVSKETINEIAATFPGVEHRCEFVRELDGVKYYNSSIDSTPTRTAAALSSFDKKLIVIIGGRDKHLDLAPLAKTLCEKAKAVILTGESIDMVKKALDACPDYQQSNLTVAIKEDFEEAVKHSHHMAQSEDIVILSPAFTSFDRFNNFEERGRLFKKVVNDLDK